MQYTIRNIPKHVDEALRRRAAEQGKSLNEVAIEAIVGGLEASGTSIPKRDLSDFAGTWVDDPEFWKIIEEQQQIDPDMWK